MSEFTDRFLYNERPRRGNAGKYMNAMVCNGGHLIAADCAGNPEDVVKFCAQCGEPTIINCPSCGEALRGAYEGGGLYVGASVHNYCHSCGKPYPWTEASIQAAIELSLDSGKLNSEEQKQFAESLKEISKDSPRAPLAIERIRRLIGKMGTATGDALGKILIGVATEAAKKAIFDQ